MVRRQFLVLYREFLFRLIDRELLSAHAQGDVSKLVLQVVALLIFVSLLASFPAVSFTSDLPSRARFFVGLSMEHFLIATTMLTVGLFAVLSWDGMFPDRRDVLVLAPLPVPAFTIFLAKAASIATALSLTVLALHLIAGIVWPMVLNAAMPAATIPALTSDSAVPPVSAAGGLTGLIRLFAAYWITMLAAGIFMFGLVMGMQGVAAQLLPRRAFLRVSSFLQMGAFTLIVGVYCLQPILVRPSTVVEVQQPGLLAWSPSYWFLGLFQQLAGSPALAPLARPAWIGLAIVLGATAAAYAGSYMRTLRRMVDEPDIVPVGAAASWLPRLGNGVHTAVVHFSIRTLLRSRQHRLLLAFYAGIGFALTIFLLKAPFAAATSAGHRWDERAVPLIASSVLMLGFWVLGTRVTCAMPVDLRSNWIFRVTPIDRGRVWFGAVRLALVVLAILPMWTASAVMMFSLWPWRAALGHLLVLALSGLVLVELCLLDTRKLPFTCSYLPGKSHVHATFWVLVCLLVPLAVKAAAFERDALRDATRFAAMLLALGLVWMGLRWRAARRAHADEAPPMFEETDSGQPLRLDVWDSRFASIGPDRE